MLSVDYRQIVDKLSKLKGELNAEVDKVWNDFCLLVFFFSSSK